MQVVVVHGGAHTVLTKQIFEAEELVDGGVVNESYFAGRVVRFGFKALYRAVEQKLLNQGKSLHICSPFERAAPTEGLWSPRAEQLRVIKASLTAREADVGVHGLSHNVFTDAQNGNVHAAGNSTRKQKAGTVLPIRFFQRRQHGRNSLI